MAYDRETLFKEICERLAEGEPLRVICRDLHMPAWRTIYLWLDEDKDYAARFAQARASGFDAIAEDCLHIANTPVEGVEVTTKADGTVEQKRGDMLGHRKLQIETRLKLLAKWDPKRYGDRIAMEHSVDTSLADRLARARARVDGQG